MLQSGMALDKELARSDATFVSLSDGLTFSGGPQ